ncbi:MAG TPA: type II toxin-antitoxin system HicA family toxin [Candidatus Paceibacterota bacterium]|nr:type II toxin-antitoxin system HicA family toxin [Candidatus Paceibacterota bacterium]
MKRADLISHLQSHGCSLLREGSRHTVFIHSETGRVSTIPRHREVQTFLGRKICRDLGVPQIKKK